MLNKIIDAIGMTIGYTLLLMAALIVLGVAAIITGFVWRGVVSVWNF